MTEAVTGGQECIWVECEWMGPLSHLLGPKPSFPELLNGHLSWLTPVEEGPLTRVALWLSVASSPALYTSGLGYAAWRQCLAYTAFLNLAAVLWKLSVTFLRVSGYPRSCSQWGLWKAKSSSYIPGDHTVLTASPDQTMKWGENTPVVGLLGKWAGLNVRVVVILDLGKEDIGSRRH